MAEVAWVGSTKADLSEASDSVRRTMGFALRAAQEGELAKDAMPMKGNLRDVVEIRADDEAGTYRLMYTIKIGDFVYVLDFFQKKGKKGTATPQADLDRILQRLKKVREAYAQR